MSLRTSRWQIAAAIGVLGALSVADAQTPATAGGRGPLGIAPQRDLNVSPKEASTHAGGLIQAMETSATSVRQQLETARSARDVVRVLCLNDKLNQIDVAIRSGRERAAAVRGAADRNDRERARHEYTVLTVLHERVQTLVAEANQCIGEEAGFVGESRVTVQIDPNIARVEPLPPDETGFFSAPPIISSPVR